jgi:hypothetical protein
MEHISFRNYLAAHADVSWIKNSTPENAELKTGVEYPGAEATEKQKAKFWIRVEIAWRWQYADLMLKGS